MNTLKTGALIAAARKEQNLTQSDLAAALHVSTQAVSKWERGLNFPDITLLEPLGQLLGLTVAELMAGERDTPPQEQLLQDSLRLGAAQSGRARRWRRLFAGAAGALLSILLFFGYVYIRDNTTLLPQTATVLHPVELDEMDLLTARLSGLKDLAAYDLVLADGLAEYTFQLELWDETGLVQTQELLAAREPTLRHQDLAFAFTVEEEVFSCTLSCGGAIATGSLEVPSDDFFVWNTLEAETTLSAETGAVLLCLGLDGGSGVRTASAGNYDAPQMVEDQSCVLLRLICR